MQFTVEEMSPLPLAYMRRIGPYGEGNRMLMEQCKAWAKARGLFTPEGILLGIAQDGPDTPPKHCRYDVALVVDEGFAYDDAVQPARLPGGRYGVFLIPHTPQGLQQAWQNLFSELGARGLAWDTSRRILERYVPQKVDNHLCEICVPI